jgi:hypothetical protein
LLSKERGKMEGKRNKGIKEEISRKEVESMKGKIVVLKKYLGTRNLRLPLLIILLIKMTIQDYLPREVLVYT